MMAAVTTREVRTISRKDSRGVDDIDHQPVGRILRGHTLSELEAINHRRLLRVDDMVRSPWRHGGQKLPHWLNSDRC